MLVKLLSHTRELHLSRDDFRTTVDVIIPMGDVAIALESKTPVLAYKLVF